MEVLHDVPDELTNRRPVHFKVMHDERALLLHRNIEDIRRHVLAALLGVRLESGRKPELGLCKRRCRGFEEADRPAADHARNVAELHELAVPRCARRESAMESAPSDREGRRRSSPRRRPRRARTRAVGQRHIAISSHCAGQEARVGLKEARAHRAARRQQSNGERAVGVYGASGGLSVARDFELAAGRFFAAVAAGDGRALVAALIGDRQEQSQVPRMAAIIRESLNPLLDDPECACGGRLGLFLPIAMAAAAVMNVRDSVKLQASSQAPFV